MAPWGIITIVILVIILIVFIVLNLTTTGNNRTLSQYGKVTPFSATIDPTTGKSSGFTTTSGAPQIICPTGTKINIIAAFFDVNDPYGECSMSSSDVYPLYGFMCSPDVMSPKTCASDEDCPDSNTGRFFCDPSAQHCRLRPNPSKCSPTSSSNLVSANITVGGKTNSYCIDKDICGTNISGSQGTGVPNPICSPSNTTAKCAMRDAAASVAAKCDGRQSCPDLTMADFGDFPCAMPPSNCIDSYDGNGFPNWLGYKSNMPRTGYCGLPYLPGYAGGTPPDSSQNNSDPASSSLGYNMHGIYMCVPE